MSEYYVVIKKIIADILHKESEEVTDTDLSNLDSMGRITLVVGIENAYKIEMLTEPLDAACFESLQKLSGIISGKIRDVR